MVCRSSLNGRPVARNPYARVDEGDVALGNPRHGSLLYKNGLVALGALATLVSSTEAAGLAMSTNYIASVATSLSVVCDGLAKPHGVWIAWDDVDLGATTNGWANVRFVKAVRPESPVVECPLPDGWGGDGKKALRFFLSEVPGDVECTLTSMEAAGENKASPYLITDKTLTGAAKVELDCTLKDTSGTKGLFCSRGSSTSKNQFTLFALVGNRWRFDYNTKTGTNADYDKTAQPKEGTDYSIVASSAGLYVNNKKAQDCSTGAWTGVCDGALTIFAYHGGTPGSPTGTSQMILRSFKVTDAAFSLDLVPARQGGVVGALDLVSGAFIGPSGTGAFTPGDRVEADDPFIAVSDVVGPIPAVGGDRLVFSTETELADSTTHADGIPGEKTGSGILALSGANDFGGSFLVSGGTLLADFGAGLGVNDNLKLTSGCFGATSGTITAALGTGAGEINLAGGAVGFTAAKGDLMVNLGGAGADVVSQGTEPLVANPLVLNDAHGTHTLTVANKIVMPGDLTIDTEAGRAVLTGGVACQGLFTKAGGGELVVSNGASIVATPSNPGSSAARIHGRLTLCDEATFQATHSILLYGKSSSTAYLVISNATLNLGDKWIYSNVEGEADAYARILVYDGAKVTATRINISQGEMQLFGGEVTATGGTTEGVALGGGTEAVRLFGGTLETDKVRSSANKSAFEFRGGRVRAREDTTMFFAGNLQKTRVSRDGGAFDTNGHELTISHALVSLSGENESSYSRATALTVPAFRKEGSGILAITKKISYVCATEVQGGTFKLGSNDTPYPCLPDAGLVRLTGGGLDLNHQEQTIGNLVGSGRIEGGGTLTVTGEIVPMAVDGVAAKIVVNKDDDTAQTPTRLVGRLVIPIGLDGKVGAILASDDTLDVSGLDLVIEGAENLPGNTSLTLVEAGTKIEGSFKSVTGVPAGWRLSVNQKRVSLTNQGLILLFR